MTQTVRKMEAGRKLAYANLGRVLVLGRGVTGSAVIEYLEPLVGTRVSTLEVWDGEPGSGSFDLCIASPGISEFSDIYQCAKESSTEVISEVEFAWRESAATSRWIAITGTNGKTTTTSLIAHILSECGMDVRLVGNIGDTCISAVAKDVQSLSPNSEECIQCSKFVTYVVEMSSYQLASTQKFFADVSVVLNIKPDHLSWHKSHENYAAAKWKILKNVAQGDLSNCAVLNATDDEVRAYVRTLRQEESNLSYIPLGSSDGINSDMRQKCGAANAAFVNADGKLTVAYKGVEHTLARVTDLKILGRHNVENALAAASTCIAFSELPKPFEGADGATSESVESIGLEDAKISAALATFEPIAHRIETVGESSGVKFVNDSKATNVDATLAALTAFPDGNAIILLGGRDKGTDLTELVSEVSAQTKACVLFGESYERFAAAFDAQDVGYSSAKGLSEAVKVAYEIAKPGDVVLLSPACASFDEFSCFEERGERFSELVSALPDKEL